MGFKTDEFFFKKVRIPSPTPVYLMVVPEAQEFMGSGKKVMENSLKEALLTE
jgi:hypothetical protein